jgi:adenosylmethionine-8-amino-7-oxononanoate aminotransferase
MQMKELMIKMSMYLKQQVKKIKKLKNKNLQKYQMQKKGVKNVRGDYIVTKIEIPDIRDKKDGENKKQETEEDSSSDEGYGDEEDK